LKIFIYLLKPNLIHRIYEHQQINDRTIFIGIVQRCENRQLNVTSTLNKFYSICDDNKYNFNKNINCTIEPNQSGTRRVHSSCNGLNNPCHCDYSSITKGLLSCTIISACALGISLILIFSHILINQYQYKIHMNIAAITILVLFLGFIFILITLILLGSTMSYDLYQYHYDLDYKLANTSVLIY
jgi:hypothetical protein